MSGPFSYGVTALDEALIEKPVFTSEVGLSHRRTKLEFAASRAFRAFVEDARDTGLVDAAAARALLEELPEAPPASGIKSRY